MKTEIDCGVLTPPIREERDQIVTCQFAILNTPFPSTILEQFFSYLNTMLTLAMRVPSYDGFDVVVLSADTVI